MAQATGKSATGGNAAAWGWQLSRERIGNDSIRRGWREIEAANLTQIPRKQQSACHDEPAASCRAHSEEC
jgi:hypothetical protein